MIVASLNLQMIGLLVLPAVFLATKRILLAFFPIENKIEILACLQIYLAITVLATAFLNYGLAVWIGLLANIVCNRFERRAYWYLLPSILLAFAMASSTLRPFILEISKNILVWNYGIPLVLIQPLFIEYMTLTRNATKKLL